MKVPDHEKKDCLTTNIHEILLYPQMNVNLVSEISRLKLARAFSKEAKKRYGDRIEEIILYGSVARGEDGNDSDIDLLVVASGNEDALQMELADIAYEIGYDETEMIAVHVYSRDEVRRHKGLAFFRNVEDDGIRIG
jgi:predicted nucleotidyltransferase